MPSAPMTSRMSAMFGSAMAEMSLCAQRPLVLHDLRARGVQRGDGAVEARHRAPIQFGEQLLLAGRDQIDQFLVQRLASP